MWLEEQLRSLIAKTATDFDETAAADRAIPSQEDGTDRGKVLDNILASQKIQREELWSRLHELEDRHRDAGLQKVFGEGDGPEQKQNAVHLHEEQELRKEIKKQENVLNDIVQPSEAILELQFKDQLDRSIKELRQTLAFVESELADAQGALSSERKTLDECGDIKAVLERRLDDIVRSGGPQSVHEQLREKHIALREKHQLMMDDLIEFLDQHYPPHKVDITRDGVISEEKCEIKYILQDLMNFAVVNPSNPYLDLQPGTYWSPYVETLVKARIAVRHPKDSSKLRLVDFLQRDV